MSPRRFIDAQKCDGSTSLHLAAQTGHVSVVDVLLSKVCEKRRTATLSISDAVGNYHHHLFHCHRHGHHASLRVS